MTCYLKDVKVRGEENQTSHWTSEMIQREGYTVNGEVRSVRSVAKIERIGVGGVRWFKMGIPFP